MNAMEIDALPGALLDPLIGRLRDKSFNFDSHNRVTVDCGLIEDAYTALEKCRTALLAVDDLLTKAYAEGRKDEAEAWRQSQANVIERLHGLEAAERTLQRLGYTHRGGVEWAPPIGRAPEWLLVDNPTHHDLKTDPDTFQATWDGIKTFEIRFNDRGFKVGDILHLKETVASGEQMRTLIVPLAYTGREIRKTVRHILTGYGLQPGWVCLSHG